MAETNYISSIKTSDGKRYGIKDPDARIRMTEITWHELVSLRNNSQLIPGMQYRITDYNCTTTQEDTKSANHPFDIIVTADSTNKLNEVARAIQRKGDVYFSKCNLAAWKIWYCLDNDTKRFAWADNTDNTASSIVKVVSGNNIYYLYPINKRHVVKYKIRNDSGELVTTSTGFDLYKSYNPDDTNYYGLKVGPQRAMYDLGSELRDTLDENEHFTTLGAITSGTKDELLVAYPNAVVDKNGHGVIYRMIDEHGNDCPYDFKNIMFKRYYAVNSDEPNSGTTQYGYNYISLGKDTEDYYYLFNVDTDITKYKYFYTFSYDDGVNINDASIVLSAYRNNVIGNAYINITIDDSTKYDCKWLNNIVLISVNETDAYDHNLGYYTIFGVNCTSITLINSSHNIFGDNCSNIILGSSSVNNTFSSNCTYINFENVNHSSIEEKCNNIHLSMGININFKNSAYIDIDRIYDSTLCGYNIVLPIGKIYYNIYTLLLNFDNSTDISEYLKEDTVDTPTSGFLQFIGKDSSGKVVSYTLDKIINS